MVAATGILTGVLWRGIIANDTARPLRMSRRP